MKLSYMFVATSLILAGAMVAITTPVTVEAAPKHVWCYTAASIVCGENGVNFDNKKECKDSLAEFQDSNPGVATQPCQKNLLIS